MPARLIINADDFGLTPGVNRAIAELHQAGVLTSATLMASGAAFDDALAIAHANPDLGIGCHVVLTDGDPVSPPESIPSLLGQDKRSLRPKLLDFVRDLVLGRINEAEIEIEATAQIRKLQQAGLTVTHIDTHKHTHMFPLITRPLLRVAEAHGIRAIRNPFEARWSWSLGHGGISRRIQMKILDQLRRPFNTQPQILSGAVRTPTGSIGISATGDLNQQTLAQIMEKLPEGTWELVCHPGYNDTELDAITTRLRSHRKIEYDALLTVIPEILSHPNPPALIHYGDL
jgi:hopanoid biosynthesis associated protein HpnK